MSTPLDAVFSRCRPVRLWNGSSSASRRRRATTRCWKGGYRETEVDTAVVNRGHNKVGVTFFIKEGPPTLVSDIIVNQPTPTLLSQREINKRVVLSKNSPLNMIRLDSSRVFLQTRLF